MALDGRMQFGVIPPHWAFTGTDRLLRRLPQHRGPGLGLGQCPRRGGPAAAGQLGDRRWPPERTGDQQITVHATSPVVLDRSESWSPGWRATVQPVSASALHPATGPARRCPWRGRRHPGRRPARRRATTWSRSPTPPRRRRSACWCRRCGGCRADPVGLPRAGGRPAPAAAEPRRRSGPREAQPGVSSPMASAPPAGRWPRRWSGPCRPPWPAARYTAPGSAASAVRRSRTGRSSSIRASARSRLQVAVALVGSRPPRRGDRSVATASSSTGWTGPAWPRGRSGPRRRCR